MTTTDINQLLRRLGALGQITAEETDGLVQLQSFLATQPDTALEGLELKRRPAAKKAARKAAVPKPDVSMILERIRKVFDDPALGRRTSQQIQGEIDQALKGVALGDLKKVAAEFVGGGVAKLKKQGIVDQILSKIYIRHGHMSAR